LTFFFPVAIYVVNNDEYYISNWYEANFSYFVIAR